MAACLQEQSLEPVLLGIEDVDMPDITTKDTYCSSSWLGVIRDTVGITG